MSFFRFQIYEYYYISHAHVSRRNFNFIEIEEDL